MKRRRSLGPRLRKVLPQRNALRSLATPAVTAVHVLMATIALLFAGDALASEFGRPHGEIHLSASKTSYVGHAEVGPSFQFIDFYILSDFELGEYDPADGSWSNGMWGWEARLELPPGVILTQAEPYWMTCTLGRDPDEWTWMFGWGVPGSSNPIPLMTCRALVLPHLAAPDLVLRLIPDEPSSFDPPALGFFDSEIVGECFDEDGVPVRCRRPVTGNRALSIQRKVAAESKSWGSMKGSYREGSR